MFELHDVFVADGFNDLCLLFEQLNIFPIKILPFDHFHSYLFISLVI